MANMLHSRYVSLLEAQTVGEFELELAQMARQPCGTRFSTKTDCYPPHNATRKLDASTSIMRWSKRCFWS